MQLRTQGALRLEEIVGAANRLEAVAVGGAATQAFWHVMACVSQPVTQAVDACEDINGVGTSGTGATWPGVTTCASRIR